jgi:hypothetical protein
MDDKLIVLSTNNIQSTIDATNDTIKQENFVMGDPSVFINKLNDTVADISSLLDDIISKIDDLNNRVSALEGTPIQLNGGTI